MSLCDQSIPGLTLPPHAALSIHPRQENGLESLEQRVSLVDFLIRMRSVVRAKRRNGVFLVSFGLGGFVSSSIATDTLSWVMGNLASDLFLWCI